MAPTCSVPAFQLTRLGLTIIPLRIRASSGSYLVEHVCIVEEVDSTSNVPAPAIVLGLLLVIVKHSKPHEMLVIAYD